MYLYRLYICFIYHQWGAVRWKVFSWSRSRWMQCQPLRLLHNDYVTEAVELLTLTKDSCSNLTSCYTTGDLRLWSGATSVMYSTSVAEVEQQQPPEHPQLLLTKAWTSFGVKSLIGQCLVLCSWKYLSQTVWSLSQHIGFLPECDQMDLWCVLWGIFWHHVNIFIRVRLIHWFFLLFFRVYQSLKTYTCAFHPVTSNCLLWKGSIT